MLCDKHAVFCDGSLRALGLAAELKAIYAPSLRLSLNLKRESAQRFEVLDKYVRPPLLLEILPVLLTCLAQVCLRAVPCRQARLVEGGRRVPHLHGSPSHTHIPTHPLRHAFSCHPARVCRTSLVRWTRPATCWALPTGP